MDESSPRKRQNERSLPHPSNPRYHLQDGSHQGQSPSTSSNERYRPPPINSISRTMGTTTNYGTYYQEPGANFSAASVPPNILAYGQDYSQDARNQSQPFAGFNAPTMMYGVPHASAQAPVYDSNQYAPRQPTTLQMMSGDVAPTYFGSDASNPPGSSRGQTGHGSSGVPTTTFQQTPSMSFPMNMSGPLAMPQNATSTGAPMAEAQDYEDGAALAEKWVNYQRQLGATFQAIKAGSLEVASETLLSVSNWLLPQVVDLGLSMDDANLHADRIKLWNDFNHAWLALGHQQKVLMQPGVQLSEEQTVLSRDQIIKMGKELIGFCDYLERHGLVDYQYGVWEDEIESVLEECLDLYPGPEEPGSSVSLQ